MQPARPAALHVGHFARCTGVLRAKASVPAEAEALPAEKDVQLGALQDCNAQMLQVRTQD